MERLTRRLLKMRLRGVKVGQPVPSENSIVAELWLVWVCPCNVASDG